MKRMPTLIVIGLLCLTAAGCVSTRSIDIAAPPPSLTEPDRSVLVDCLGPVRLPSGTLTQRDVERLWITDRKALIDCGKRHAALRDFYKSRDALVAAK